MDNKKENYWRLRKWIQELGKIDSQLRERGYYQDFYNKAMNLQDRIKEFLADKPSVKLDLISEKGINKIYNRDFFVNHLQEYLQKDIYESFGLKASGDVLLRLYIPHDSAKEIINVLNESKHVFESQVDYYEEEDPSEGYLWVIYSELSDITRNLIERRRNIGVLFTSVSKLPDFYETNLDEIKRCFSLGLYRSSIIFCRVVLEFAIYDFLKKRGGIKDTTDDISGFKNNINRAKRYLDKQTHDKIHDIRIRANKLLHKKESIIMS